MLTCTLVNSCRSLFGALSSHNGSCKLSTRPTPGVGLYCRSKGGKGAGPEQGKHHFLRLLLAEAWQALLCVGRPLLPAQDLGGRGAQGVQPPLQSGSHFFSTRLLTLAEVGSQPPVNSAALALSAQALLSAPSALQLQKLGASLNAASVPCPEVSTVWASAAASDSEINPIVLMIAVASVSATGRCLSRAPVTQSLLCLPAPPHSLPSHRCLRNWAARAHHGYHSCYPSNGIPF